MVELKAVGFDANFRDEALYVELEYESVQSVGEEAQRKHLFQLKWKNEKGVVIPLEQIQVSPKAGDIYTSITGFQVKINEPLYVGLWGVHQDNVNALAFAKRNLEFLKNSFATQDGQIRLLEWGIKGLDRIIDPAGEYSSGIKEFLEERLRLQSQLEWPYLENKK